MQSTASLPRVANDGQLGNGIFLFLKANPPLIPPFSKGDEESSFQILQKTIRTNPPFQKEVAPQEPEDWFETNECSESQSMYSLPTRSSG